MNRNEIEVGQRVRWVAGGRPEQGKVQELGRAFALVKPDLNRAYWVEIGLLTRVTE